MTEATKVYVKESSPWVKFLAVISLIAAIFMIISGLVLIISGTATISPFGDFLYDVDTGLPQFAMGIGYVIGGGITIIPTVYMLKCAKGMKGFKADESEESLELAAKNLKRLVKFSGILTIVMLAFVLVIFVFALIAGIAMAF
ncbi:MAG: DUF5362 family protein [Spirochaetaceae bacterium]|jgi:hypothetical protein|nr:DUF5362 family protein [Spirochaetaceae bacterium]